LIGFSGEVGVAYTLVLHINNQDPVVGEVDELPTPTDNMILLNNPRKMDGKELAFVGENVISLIWPVDRINFIEVLVEREDQEIIGFVRE
jgi:hypothetical protein